MYYAKIVAKITPLISNSSSYVLTFSKPVKDCYRIIDANQLNNLIQKGLAEYYYVQPIYSDNYLYEILSASFYRDIDDIGNNISYNDNSDDNVDVDVDIKHFENIFDAIRLVDQKHINCKPNIKYCGCGCDSLHDGYDGYCTPYSVGSVKFRFSK